MSGPSQVLLCSKAQKVVRSYEQVCKNSMISTSSRVAKTDTVHHPD